MLRVTPCELCAHDDGDAADAGRAPSRHLMAFLLTRRRQRDERAQKQRRARRV